MLALTSGKRRSGKLEVIAIATLEISRYEFGLEIGQQIGIAGLEEIEQASWPSFELTTYSFPLQRIETVGSIVLGAHSTQSGHHVVDGVLKARRSTQRNRS